MSLRSAAVAAALATVMTIPAHAAEQYGDPEGRFSVTVPEGWQTGAPKDKSVAVVIGKLAGKDLDGLCVVVVTPTPATKSMPQTQIDTELGAVVNTEFWTNAYKAQGAQDIVITNTGTRDASGGRKIQTVAAEFATKGPSGTLVRVKTREEVHAVPGRMHDIGCLAPIEKFEEVKADIDKILMSYDPQGGVIAQAPAIEPSVATLYARSDFTGVARVLKGSAANVSELSWPPQTGSIAISGFGEWQVCEGANFTGTCTVLTGARTAAQNGALRVGSLRPITSSTPAQGAASAIATNSTRIVNEALQHFPTQQ